MAELQIQRWTADDSLGGDLRVVVEKKKVKTFADICIGYKH